MHFCYQDSGALVIAYMVASGLTILQCLLTKPVGQTWQTGQEIKE